MSAPTADAFYRSIQQQEFHWIVFYPFNIRIRPHTDRIQHLRACHTAQAIEIRPVFPAVKLHQVDYARVYQRCDAVRH